MSARSNGAGLVNQGGEVPREVAWGVLERSADVTRRRLSSKVSDSGNEVVEMAC